MRHLQRVASQGADVSAGRAEDEAADLAHVQRTAVDRALQSAAHPLEPSLQQEMESRYGGADFSGVQVHDGPLARDAAALIGAKAFAAEQHIVDGGAMNKRDWAHELAHTLDPESPLGTDNGAGLSISDPADRGERFATTASDRAMSGPIPVPRVPAEARPAAGDRHRHGPGHGGSVQRVASGRSPVREPHAHAAGDGCRGTSAGRAGRAATVQRAPLGGTATRQPPAPQETGQPARGEGLRLRDHEGAELFSGDDEQLTAYVRHLAATDRSDIFRLLLNRLRTQGFAAQADNVRQVWEGADRPPSTRRVEVPRELHFIWLGGKPGNAVEDNLNAWKENAGDGDWTLNLWTAASGSTLKDLTKTFGNHLKIHADSDKLVKENAGEENYRIYKDAEKRKAYNLASDILRYTVMKLYGGVYMDVDIAPGGVRLTAAPRVLMHSEEVPLFGPRLRDRKSVRTALGRAETDQEPTPEDLDEAATARYGKGVLGNRFILAPGSAFMDELLKNLPKNLTDLKEKHGAKAIEKDPKGKAPIISGPPFVEQMIKEFAGQHHGVMGRVPGAESTTDLAINPDELQHLFQPEALEFCKALGWVTPESENQLDDEPGPSRKQSLLRRLTGKK
ncbi:DUF4157 domain-containing protein [Streptomyces sp. NPDC093097]|uniref:eCIS core domain-containing protein n=1 Tax=Streptomyces sp. NPDC093097 TaxID=3366027 RepID=UPI0038018804